MYYFTLRTEDGNESMVFPMNPDSLEISLGANNEDYHLMKIGEVVSPGFPQCKGISFSSWLPPEVKPRNYIALWERYLKEKRVLRLILTGDSPRGESGLDLNLPVVMEKLKLTEKGGEPGAVFFDFSFKEYRSFSLKVVTS